MNSLEMLTSREQLMEDIESIVDGELNGIISDGLNDELVRRIDDAVCKFFPCPVTLKEVAQPHFTADSNRL